MLLALLVAAAAPCPVFHDTGPAELRSLSRLYLGQAMSHDTGIGPNAYVRSIEPFRAPGDGFARTAFSVFQPGLYGVGMDVPGELEVYSEMKGHGPLMEPIAEERPAGCPGVSVIHRYWLAAGSYDLRGSKLSTPRVTFMLTPDW